MKRTIIYLVLMMLSGLLMAADYSLPAGYWEQPKAKNNSGKMHDWSDLEQDLRPEACAQCHYDQFSAWKNSLHAHAYSEGMVGQFPAMGHAAGNRCLKCHAPLQEQRYGDAEAMKSSLRLKLQQPEGVQADADLEAANLPLRHSGVSCAACHVRGYQRFGPPRAGSAKTGHIRTDVHGGFHASKDFEQSNFCAGCHQFPQSRAINGKPLENTVEEWKQSRFAAKDGKTCQQCHMPFRRHAFKGIHDPETVRNGLNIKVKANQTGGATIAIHSTGIGHAFPTYVTPKVIVIASAQNNQGRELRRWQWEIVRQVEYRQQWVELKDTRIMPDELRKYNIDQAPKGSKKIHFIVRVIPDAFYREMYQQLLKEQQEPTAKALLQRAEQRTHASEFTLFEKVVDLSFTE